MAWFAYLSPCGYLGAEFADSLVAIGWLARGQAFPTGAVAPEVYSRLVELLKSPWDPCSFFGVHGCDLCQYEGENGKRNLFVPSGRVVFVCPELVVHYMNAHWYCPPEEFCAAVLACPPMRSVPYLKNLLAGARPLVQRFSAKLGEKPDRSL